LQGLDHVVLETDEDADGIFVRTTPDVVRVAMRVGDDLAAVRLGSLGQASLADQEGRLLLGAADDPLGLLLRFVDDPLALGVDPLGRTDLLGDSDAKLVDETESRILVDDDVRRERQLLAIGDQGLEALDEEDDVDRSVLPAAGVGVRVAQADCKYGTPGTTVSDPAAPRRGPSERALGSSTRRRHRSSRSP